MKFIKTPVKGMCDMLPSDMRLREHVLSMIKKSYGQYGFMQIETPIVEHIENLTSKQGGDNEKLIFKVMKRGADLQRAIDKGTGEFADNGLRYDLTVPLARYYACNKEKLPSPFKALQMGNVYRADNPQKGRFRQFTQCDIDILGDDSNLAEIELITATASMLSQIFAQINISGFTIHINDRRMLSAVALCAGFNEEDVGSVLISLDKFDKIGLEGIEKELLDNGYAAETVEKYLSVYRAVKEGITIEEFCAGISEDYLGAAVKQNLADIIGCVAPVLAEGVKIVFDPTLVRGMGYYTGTIFEVKLDEYNFSIAGGGRYDEMIGKFSGQKVPACGFSIGFERIITILKDHPTDTEGENKEKIAYLVAGGMSEEKLQEIFLRAAKEREEGKTVTVLPLKKNAKFQIDRLMEDGFEKIERIYND